MKLNKIILMVNVKILSSLFRGERFDRTKYLFEIVPRENRKLNKSVADHYGYFWLPCPICHDYFAGFEWLTENGGHTIRKIGVHGSGVCYKEKCDLEAEKLSDTSPLTCHTNIISL